MFELKKSLKFKMIVVPCLIIAGIFFGYVYLNAFGKSTSTILVHMDLDDGVVFGVGDSLGPEEREEIKAYAIKKVVEDEEIKELLSGREYKIEATIHGVQSIKDILQNSTLIRSETRIILEKRLVVTVTITFNGGSGYNIQVDIEDWSLGEPIFSENVTPPTLFREAVEHSLNRTRKIP